MKASMTIGGGGGQNWKFGDPKKCIILGAMECFGFVIDWKDGHSGVLLYAL